MVKYFSIAILLCFLVYGCTHSIHQVHVSDFSPYHSEKEGKLIKARGEQFVILNFTTQTQYVENTLKELLEQCPNGHIEGITSQWSTSHNFLSYTNKILMQGLCVN